MCNVSRKNRQKGLLFFMDVDINTPLSLRTRQSLVGFAERYAAVYRELKPMMICLYKMLGGYTHLAVDIPIPLTEQAQTAIILWRVYLISSAYDSLHDLLSGRDISFWSPSAVSFWIEFDGSLFGLGYRIFDALDSSCISAGSVPVPISFFPNNTRKSDYQNSVELLALVAGIIHTVRLGAHTCSLNIRGDSETVLHWSLTDKFRSTIAIPVIILFIAICDHFKIHIQSGIHISGKDNFICDTLSRLRTSDPCPYGKCGPNGPSIP
jgi:hypothetical protein